MKYIFIPYLFNVINIHILHYKLSQTSNSLTEKSQSGHSLRDGGSKYFHCTPSVSKYLSLLTFFNFDHSSYSKNISHMLNDKKLKIHTTLKHIADKINCTCAIF
jgi:hypothetical protein